MMEHIETEDIMPLPSSGSTNWDLYADYNTNETPVKYVRISLHVFQRNDGTGNFSDNSTSRNYLSGEFLNKVNSKFSNLRPMNLPTHSAYYKDSRVQFVLGGIYFWKDDYGWDLSCENGRCNITDGRSTVLYNKYIVNDTGNNVAYRDNSIHIFMGENDYARGQASGIGDKRHIIISGIYTGYISKNTENAWIEQIMANLLAHELGHSLGLYHTWYGNDSCNDTPHNDNEWQSSDNSTSNNIMDYNTFQNALTNCQINRMHYYLLGNAGNISDCVVNDITVKEPYLSDNNLICDNGTRIYLKGMQFGFTADWSTESSLLVSQTSGFGTTVALFPFSTTNTSGQLDYTINKGKYGISNLSKSLVSNSISSSLITNKTGNLSNGIYYGNQVNFGGVTSVPTRISNNKEVNVIATESISLKKAFSVEKGSSLNLRITNNCE